MAYSRFTAAQLDTESGTVSVSGPFEFGPNEPRTEVEFFHFVIVQGDEFVSGDGQSRGDGNWSGTADAGNLDDGPAQGFGVAVLVRQPQETPPPGSPPAVQTFTWSEPIEITA
jgi:hypothetical protein